MDAQNTELVLKFLRAMGTSDAATAANCLAPDAYTQAKGFGKFAGTRYFDTIVATIAAFKTLVPTGLSPEVHTVTAAGDRVVVEFEGKATLSNGEQYNNQYCMVFTLKDGKIKQVNEYFCTILADQKLWPLVEAMGQELQAK